MIGVAVVEAVAVAVLGLVLGCVVAAAGLAGIGGAVHKAIGATVVYVPWTLLTVVATGSVAVVAVTGAITAFRDKRTTCVPGDHNGIVVVAVGNGHNHL